MPIPLFDHNLVLPPHLGNPAQDPASLSPYPASSEEVCRRFATTPERRIILEGWLNFRERVVQFGITQGFQWLDGSFMEGIEILENRPPKDLDIVTFFTARSDPNTLLARLKKGFPEFLDHSLSKATFRLDHFPVQVDADPYATVELTRYWVGLFSHRRDGVWKGMLRVDLSTPADDTQARDYLRSLS